MIIKYFKTKEGHPFHGYSLNGDKSKLVYSQNLIHLDHVEITEQEYQKIINSILKIG